MESHRAAAQREAVAKMCIAWKQQLILLEWGCLWHLNMCSTTTTDTAAEPWTLSAVDSTVEMETSPSCGSQSPQFCLL